MHIDVPVWKQKMRKRRSPAVACSSWVSRYVAAAMVLVSSHVGAQATQPGAWDVTSTVVELSVPGVPGFIQRMIKGKAKAEHKRLSEGQGVDALLAPDPRAKCRIDDQRIADGKYTQSLSCPQKKGSPLQIARAGTYDANGFTGRRWLAEQRREDRFGLFLISRLGALQAKTQDLGVPMLRRYPLVPARSRTSGLRRS